MTTAFYAAILGIVQLSLMTYVIFGRWKYRVSLGDGDESRLRRRIRAHGNFVETVPMALLLMWFAENYVFNQWVAHVFGSVLLIGRLLHVYGLVSNRSTVNRFRQLGTALTMGVIGVLAIWLIVGLSPTVF